MINDNIVLQKKLKILTLQRKLIIILPKKIWIDQNNVIEIRHYWFSNKKILQKGIKLK